MAGLIVDLFAGGGGASLGCYWATGRHPDVAVNHDADAIGVHTANHPETRHYLCDVREVDPIEACSVAGALQPVDLLWASPDCTHFSKARGGKPVEKGIRSLADVVLVWADKVRPRVIALENVEEFQDWGPVLENGQPCPDGKGIDFRRFVRGLESCGYVVDHRPQVAADHGAPTTRKRLVLIATLAATRVIWPEATFAPRDKAVAAGKRAWRSAAEHVIDWSIPVPSIFDRKRPLVTKTRARIAKGIKRFVIDAAEPFLVGITHSNGDRTYSQDDPTRTVTGANRGEFSLIAPTLVPHYGERNGQEPRALDAARPYPTVVATGNGGDLAGVFLQKMAENGRGSELTDPLLTAMAQAPRHYIAAAQIRQFGSTVSGRPAGDPAASVMAEGSGGKSGVIAAAMVQNNGGRVGRDAGEPVTTLTDRSTQQSVMAVSLDAYYATGVPASPTRPLRTATAEDRHGVTAAYIEQANGGGILGRDARSPLSTIVGTGSTQRLVDARLELIGQIEGARRAAVLRFLWDHFGEPTEDQWADPAATAESRLRFGIVILGGQVWVIVDIGMRMLVPRELFNAQGFPASYIIDRTADGRPVTKTAQTSMAGNSVCPHMAEAVLRPNLSFMALPERRVA